jgi:hypothetical protein
MPLPVSHPLNDTQVDCYSASIGATPASAFVRVPSRGRLMLVGAVAGGAITTADAAIAVKINGVTVPAAAFTVPVAGAAAGQNVNQVPTASTFVNEDDVISFTPSGASGAAVPASFYAVIRRG